MKTIVNNEYIQKLIESYERLGFDFHEDNLCNFVVDIEGMETNYDQYCHLINVTYINEKNESITKPLEDLRLTDLNSAYIHSNDIVRSKKQRLANGEAFSNLIYLSANPDVRTKINKMLVNGIIERKNSDIIDNTVAVVEDNKKDTDTKKEITPATRNEIANAKPNEIVKTNDKKQELRNISGNPTALRNAPKTKVVTIQNDKETADKARNSISKDSTLVTASAIILAVALGFAAYSCGKTAGYNDGYSKSYEDATDIDINEDINNTIVNDNNSETEEVVTEPTNDETATEETNEEQTEEVKKEISVHSDEFINEVVDNALNTIQLNADPNLTAKYGRDLVEALVRYTHHDYEEYTGENLLSNEEAYEDFSELVNHKFDISMFYDGLNNYENLKALYNATKEIKQEKNKYDDEFKVYACLGAAMDDMDKSDYPEAIGVRAYVDNISVIPSMQMARQQEGVLEMIDTPELWVDVDKDGVKSVKTIYMDNGYILCENAEGKDYEEEKANAKAAKYGEMTSEKCAEIYRRISSDDPNSELARLCIEALDEDDARVRTR